MKPKKSNTYCHYPFHEITLKNWRNGKLDFSLPCCHMADRAGFREDWKIEGVENLTPEEIYNHPRMEQLRQNALNGVRDPACGICWKNEDRGLQSFRMYSDDRSFLSMPDNKISVDIIASNICNLRCRMCTPTASHQLMKDYNYFRENNQMELLEESFGRFVKSKPMQATESVQWEWMMNNTHKIGNLKGSGGEPFYDKKAIALIKRFVETGDAKNTNIFFHTNATQFTDEMCDLLSNFKMNYHVFSVDGVGKTYEYIRYPQKFNELDNSIRNYMYKVSKRHVTKFTMILSALNVLNIVDWIQWIIETIDPKAAIIINEVYPEDRGIHIKHLPIYILMEAQGKLKQIEGKYQYIPKSTYDNILNILEFYINNNEQNDVKFYNEISMFDKSRNQNYQDYLDPILVKHLDKIKNDNVEQKTHRVLMKKTFQELYERVDKIPKRAYISNNSGENHGKRNANKD
jgi:organic radical activating enzyme